MSTWDYYSQAFPRILDKAWEQLIDQGLPFTAFLFFCSMAVVWLFTHLAHMRKPLVPRSEEESTWRNQLRGGFDGLIRGLFLLIFALFVWFFFQDAPQQVSEASKATLDAQTIAAQRLVDIQGADGKGGLTAQVADLTAKLQAATDQLDQLKNPPPKK